MTIDRFTVFVEIVNFLMLLWLLKRFLYTPILNAMDQREQAIAQRLQEADSRLREVAAESERYHTLRDELETNRISMLREAEEDALEARRAMIRQARAEVDAMQHDWQTTLEQEQTAFLRNVQREVGRGAFDVARTIIANVADADLEAQIIAHLLGQITTAEESTREQILCALKGTAVTVTTSFIVSRQLRDTLETQLSNLIGETADLSYCVDPTMLCGIRLSTGAYQVTWEAGDTIDRMRLRFIQLISGKTSQAPNRVIADKLGAENGTGSTTINNGA